MSIPCEIQLERLTRGFAGSVVLNHIDLRIERGQFVVLLGKSGSGKSTLLRALAELDDDAEGGGHLEVPDERAVLFQDSRLLPWESALDNVILGLDGPQAQSLGKQALANVGLRNRENAWPNQLSGGEQQRVALARALVSKPRLILADEPFGALDALTRLQMQDLLREVVARHAPTVVMVTHDVDEALLLADRILVLENGRIGQDLIIDLQHPRKLGDLEIERRQLLASLGVELNHL